MFGVLRKFFYMMVVRPVERSLRLVVNLTRNGRTLARAVRRGATTDIRRNAPVKPGMTSSEVAELDKWWATLSKEERRNVWAEYDAELEASVIAAEAAGKGTWSLTQDLAKRERALKRIAISYFVWMSIFSGYLGAFFVALFLGRATIFFVLMSVCFLALIAPQVISLRVMRAQLIYGRKVSFLEFFLPLPSTLKQEHV